MDIKDLIPQHKFDFERTEKLKQLDKNIIRPIISDLLIWLQDGNWPIFAEVRDILLPFNKELVPHIRYIFKTNDADWKYFLLSGLVRVLPKETLAEMRQDLSHIAYNPSETDKASGVHETAKEILSTID